jgi:hypothetical protein
MGSQSEGKLNWLQRNLPEGLLIDAAWLESKGFSSALRSKYTAHGWLDALAHGVYRRPAAKLSASPESEKPRWQHVVISLQMVLGVQFAVGGRTALEQQGFSHYLSPSGPNEIHLYGCGRPPGWLSRVPVDARLIVHNAAKLFRADSASGRSTLIQQPWGHWNWPILMSTPERAILELLDEVPQKETFHQADMLMEGLRNLSSRRLQNLLVDCRSVKVKRLFLWFAERHNPAWLKKLDYAAIDLGRGKRMLVRGGTLDKKFNITIPGELDARG